MTRTVGPVLAPVLEQLELEQPRLVTSRTLARILTEQDVSTPVNIVADRLRRHGWLLPTATRGTWEFVPAAVAGAFSRHDPAGPLEAHLAKHPGSGAALTLQSAAWAIGMADRVPAVLEVAVPDAATARLIPAGARALQFTPAVTVQFARSVPTLSPASIVAHAATRPAHVKWVAAREWMPDVSDRIDIDDFRAEILARRPAVRARAGYLVEPFRPDLADALGSISTGPTWLGPRDGHSRSYSERWKVIDTVGAHA